MIMSPSGICERFKHLVYEENIFMCYHYDNVSCHPSTVLKYIFEVLVFHLSISSITEQYIK